jgi:hypothetical protein
MVCSWICWTIVLAFAHFSSLLGCSRFPVAVVLPYPSVLGVEEGVAPSNIPSLAACACVG